MINAGSGISIYQTCNFESTPDEYRVLVRNNVPHDSRREILPVAFQDGTLRPPATPPDRGALPPVS